MKKIIFAFVGLVGVCFLASCAPNKVLVKNCVKVKNAEVWVCED